MAVLKDNMAAFKESLFCKDNTGFFSVIYTYLRKILKFNDYVVVHKDSMAVFIKCVVFRGDIVVLKNKMVVFTVRPS